MKTILVDAVFTLVSEQGVLFQEMYALLETYPTHKIVVTNANDEQIITYGLDKLPYPVFTMKHEPNKENPIYFKTLLEKYNLQASDCIYFEHSKEAVESAQSLGIESYYYDENKKDLDALKIFLDSHI